MSTYTNGTYDTMGTYNTMGTHNTYDTMCTYDTMGTYATIGQAGHKPKPWVLMTPMAPGHLGHQWHLRHHGH